MGSFNIWENGLSTRGYTDDQQRQYSQQAWDDLIDKVKEILENTAADCVKSGEGTSSAPVDSPCAKALLERIANPGNSSFNLDISNKMANKLSDQQLQDIKDKLEKCKKAAYQIVGGHGDWFTDTAVCDIMSPFTLTGGGFIVNFSGGLGGSYSYTGPMATAGGQHYTISLPNGVGNIGTMSGGGEGCAEEHCANETEFYVLTPLDPEASCTQ
jgi:hypothetical protein